MLPSIYKSLKLSPYAMYRDNNNVLVMDYESIMRNLYECG